MAQHDFNIANATFPSVRSDINSALTAINTTQSGTSRPTSAVAGTIWLDTTSATTPTLKYYDGADDISLAILNHTANTVNWLDSTVSITGLSSTATGTVLTLTDSASTSTVNLIIDNQKEVRFNETTANGTNYIGLKAPASVTADLTFTLPVAPTANNQALVASTAGVMSFTPYTFPASDGSANQFLKTNGSAVLSFATINAGTPTINEYDYTDGTSQTYTKPSSANWIQINLWGGGGSGGKGASNDPAGGGGGGAYNTLIIPFSYLVGTVTYKVGAGGTGITVAGVGNAGGTTEVSIANYNGTGVTKTISAYGGGAGGRNANGGRGGGGGGIYSAGGNGGTSSVSNLIQNSSQTSPSISGGGFPSRYMSGDLSTAYNGSAPIVDPFGGGFGGGKYNDGSGTSSSGILFPANTAYMRATYGGGGGGYGIDGAGTTDANGGDSTYGGGGGGGASNSGTAGVGGTSIFGGNGSNGTIDTNNSSNGSTPAGGSGGTEGGNSGDGGGGRVQFIYW